MPQLGACQVLRGANAHHARTVLRQEVDLGLLAGRSSRDAGVRFPRAFLTRFPRPAQPMPHQHGDPVFAATLRSKAGAPFAEVLLQAVLSIESMLAYQRCDLRPTDFAQVLPGASAQHAVLVWASHAPDLSRAAVEVALTGLLGLLPAAWRPDGVSPAEHAGRVEALQARAARRAVSTTTAVIVLAAHERGMPCTPMGGPHLLLGHGAAQQMLYASVPAGTTLAATQLSRDKLKTARRLAQLRLPVPRQVRVDSLEAAHAAAAQIGWPVVVKPVNGRQGGGVTVGVRDADELQAAFAQARNGDANVIVESCAPGTTYRLLVVGGRCVAAASIELPVIVGDGVHSVAALVDAACRDPLRNGIWLDPIEPDDALRACVARGGWAMDDVPPPGCRVALCTTANVTRGGVHADVTGRVHHANRELAELAARAIGLELAGVDIVSPDITRPWTDVGACIVEVNARPGLCMHAFPRHGQGRPVGAAMLDVAYPHGGRGHVPTALVLGDRGTTAVARELDLLLRAAGLRPGVVAKSSAWFDGRALDEVDGGSTPTAHRTAERLLHDPRLQALVIATSTRALAQRGLGLDGADVLAVLGDRRPDTDAALRTALPWLARALRGPVVLHADDVSAREAVAGVDGLHTILVSTRGLGPALDAHRAAGGTAVWMAYGARHDSIVIEQGAMRPRHLRLPTSRSGARADERRARQRVEAVALALALGVAPERLDVSLKDVTDAAVA